MAKSRSNPMSKSAAARIQSSAAKKSGGGVTSKSFPARAHRAASKGPKAGK